VLIAVGSDVLRNDVFRLIVGELIATAGAVALVLQPLRSRSTDRSTLYFGLAALLYGLRLIVELDLLHSAFPSIPWHVFDSSITLVIGVPFALYLGSTLGRAYPWFSRGVVIATMLVALMGAVRLLQQAPMSRVWLVNGIVIVASLAGWIYIGIFPRIPIDVEVRVLRRGLLVLGLFTGYQNLAVIGVFHYYGFVEPAGMLFLLGAFLYVSAHRSLRQETNLLAIRNELEIARQIQSALLPKLDEVIAGVEIHARYAPMGSVAGDFYDVLTDGQGLGVLIADVSGHGVPAAMSASMLKVALRAQAEHIATPEKVLSGLNRTLAGAGMLGSQFITAAYVYFDTERRELRCAGAGHPPPLLWHTRTHTVESMEENGLFLGPFPEAQYTARRRPFEPGDRCLLYTDGLVEAANGRAEEFGSSRLCDFLAGHSDLPVDPVCTALLDQVTAWSGGQLESQQDDITFVAVEFRPTGAAAPDDLSLRLAIAAE
jgi:sigma-B regulation protein RsbU (phosphoserine phosphatase)